MKTSINKEEIKAIATKAAEKVIEVHNKMTNEERLICVVTATACVSALTALNLAINNWQTKRRLRRCEKRLDTLENNQENNKNKASHK